VDQTHVRVTRQIRASERAVMKYGYSLYCEGNSPRSLIDQATKAEDAGFDFLVISDHYHPWLNEQEHAGFAWSILGAVAQATTRIELATMVTCPIIRYHPAIVAQAAATVGVISEGRFTLGLGAGENLNEHVVGHDWPPVTIRHSMLNEAIDIIEGLWRGGYFAHEGEHYRVYDARVFDLPEEPIAMFAVLVRPRSQHGREAYASPVPRRRRCNALPERAAMRRTCGGRS
jgi:G6PDH family F420-dependent oxidoreductase